MSTKIHCPQLKEIRDRLELLLARPTAVKPNATPNKFAESCITSRYVTRDDRIAALCQVDLELAAYLGAALALIPAGAAQDAAKEGDLGANLTGAFCEVVNILAGGLCVDGAPHVRWVDIAKGLATVPADAKAVLAKPCERIDVLVEIDGYGAGKLTILTAKIA